MSQNLVLSFEPQQLVLEVINTILEVAYFHLVIPFDFGEYFESDGVVIHQRSDFIFKFTVFLLILIEFFF